MQYFYAIVHKDEDSAFGVTFPDIPGCFSAADDVEDIVPKAVEALSLWFQDEEPVEPSTIQELFDANRDQLGDDAFVIAVPWIVPAKRIARVNLTMDANVLNAIDTAAKRRKQTRSAFLADAAQDMIARG